MAVNDPPFESRLIIVNSDGTSELLVGDMDIKKMGANTKSGNVLPAFLNMGWNVVNMTPFSESDKILVLIRKELNIG